MKDLLIAAIQGKRIVEFQADNHFRSGEPHLLGICDATGELQLEMYQTGGQTSGKTGRLPAWRRFDVRDIHGLQVGADTFEVQSTFNHRSKNWRSVIAYAQS